MHCYNGINRKMELEGSINSLRQRKTKILHYEVKIHIT